jgi:hypothetical protein
MTSMQTRFNLPYVPDNAVLNHARVATMTSANTVDRQRSLKQIQVMAAAGNESAITMLQALDGLVIKD